MENHHRNANKSQHNFVFASWLVSKFGQDKLRYGNQVIDVAGGLGVLCFELAVRYGVGATLLEMRSNQVKLNSMQRRRMKRITKHRLKQSSNLCSTIASASFDESLIENEEKCPLILWLKTYSNYSIQDDFNILKNVMSSINDKDFLPFSYIKQEFPVVWKTNNMGSQLIELISNASVLVGVHSDQVTESIIDAAYDLNLPFAVVPCCVFPSFFPDRKKSNGEFVQTYEQFIEYLIEKYPTTLKENLPFEGRNVVLYRINI